MTPAELYDYFTPLETALAKVFTDANFTVWTPLLPAEFQKERPRIEAVLMPGAALGFLKPDPAAAVNYPVRSGFMREKAHKSNLSLLLVTAPEITIHRAYVATALGVVDLLGLAMNDTGLMPYHAVQCVKVTGGGLTLHPETGDYQTTLNCDVDFSVKESAWADLET